MKVCQFLAANKSKAGVITTGSGLQYLPLQQGAGSDHPTLKQRVKVVYQGRLIDGTVFDGAHNNEAPKTLKLADTIVAWQEALPLMVIGDKTRFFVPSHLAYGHQAAGAIRRGSTLIFDIELLDFYWVQLALDLSFGHSTAQ